MKKRSLVCGLIPALTLGICSTSFAETAPEAAPVAVAPVATADAGTTAESIKELREKLEAKLQSTKELKARLNAKIDDLDKRIMTEQRKHWTPKFQVWGYSRLRYEKHRFEGFKPVDNSYIRLNLYGTYHIDDNWMIRNETEFDDNLTHNQGPYAGGSGNDGKQWSRRILQLFAEGNVGQVNVRVGRFFLESPYKFSFDEKVDGVSLRWGKNVKWGRAEFTASAGNYYGPLSYGEPKAPSPMMMDNTDWCTDPNRPYWGNLRYGDEGQRNKVLSFMGKVPVAKNTNMVAHYAMASHRDNPGYTRKSLALGFDTDVTRELKLRMATNKSNSNTLNRSYYASLQYKQAEPAIPGSFDIYIKKYLMRGHSGVSKWFMDDLPMGATDFTDRINEDNNLGYNDDTKYQFKDAYGAGEFNGITIGAEFVPVRSTKLKIEYTFGKMGLFSWRTGELTGKKQNYNNITAQWELFF